MMTKTRPFTIYLLKPGFDATNSLEEKDGLSESEANALPEGAILFILDSAPRPPWWREYFGIIEPLTQQLKGCVVFMPVGERCFVLCFGHVSHYIKDDVLEYDFGLRITLNSIDPKKLKSADMVSSGMARRKRTQVPISTELTYLDFDGNSEIIKSLTGKVKDEYSELFSNATGSTSLKIGLDLEPDELADICTSLLALYESDDYKTSFPNIQNIAPVNDPSKISQLDAMLVDSLKAIDGKATLTIPDIVDYRDNTCCIFQGHGFTSMVYPDISLEKFYEFIPPEFDLANMTLEDLKSFRMILTDVDGSQRQGYSIYRSLIYDGEIKGDDYVYHLCEGKWYRVEKSYISRLKSYLDPKCVDADLPSYDHDSVDKNGKAVYSEEGYNKEVPVWNNEFICLDQTDISPAGSAQIEPCDLYTSVVDPTAVGGRRGVFYHLKISTRSSHLSHLFNQGTNAADLIHLEPSSRQKMKDLVEAKLNGNDPVAFLTPLDTLNFKIVFGVITHKDKDNKSDNLPLFSKISLMRNLQQLELRKIPAAVMFIEDVSPKKEGHKKFETLTVEIIDVGGGKTMVIADEDKGKASPSAIKSCPKKVRESPIGTRFNLTVKRNDDGSLRSHHNWHYEKVD
jgi:uncharacterized protein (TIGR04141 family)